MCVKICVSVFKILKSVFELAYQTPPKFLNMLKEKSQEYSIKWHVFSCYSYNPRNTKWDRLPIKPILWRLQIPFQ